MKWIKHDTDANQDAKLQNVLLDYGLEGYGLFWYCIELIAGKVDKDNITFDLEHDARIIARNTGSTPQKVEEMMRYFVDQGLFENTAGVITCLKLAKRLDKSMTSNPEMRNIIEGLKSHDKVMTKSAVPMQDKIRLEENKDKSTEADYTRVLIDQVMDMYNTVKATERPNWTAVEARTKTRHTLTKTRIHDVQKRINTKDPRKTMDWFTNFFIALAADPFYSGRPSGTSQGYKWSIDNLFREKNFVQAIERLNDE